MLARNKIKGTLRRFISSTSNPSVDMSGNQLRGPAPVDLDATAEWKTRTVHAFEFAAELVLSRRSLDTAHERHQRQVARQDASEARHLQLLSRSTRPNETMDPDMVEYMDYCAHIGDVQGKVAMGHLYHAGTHGQLRR